MRRGYFSWSPTTSTIWVMLWLAFSSGLPMMTCVRVCVREGLLTAQLRSA